MKERMKCGSCMLIQSIGQGQQATSTKNTLKTIDGQMGHPQPEPRHDRHRMSRLSAGPTNTRGWIVPIHKLHPQPSHGIIRLGSCLVGPA